VPEQFNQNFTKCQGSNKENRQREIGKLAKKKDLVNQTKPKIWRETMLDKTDEEIQTRREKAIRDTRLKLALLEDDKIFWDGIRGIRDYEAGRYRPWSEIKKELGL